MDNEKGHTPSSNLHTDEQLQAMEVSVRERVDAFVAHLDEARQMHPDVDISPQAQEPSWNVQDYETGADLAMEEADVDTALGLMTLASDERRDPHVDFWVYARGNDKTHIVRASETVDLLAQMHGAHQLTRSPVNENGLKKFFKQIGRPANGIPDLEQTSIYRFI